MELFGAFVDRKRWRQAELARRLEMTVPALRKHLTLMTKLLPLQSVTEHPDVFWFLPNDWRPEGIVLRGTDGAALLRILARAPRSAERDRLLALLLGKDRRLLAPTRVAASPMSVDEDRFLSLVEDAGSKLTPLRMKYSSARRGDTDWRVVSVARIMPGPPSRFLGVCHRSNELRSFRVSSIQAAQLDPNEAHREPSERELAQRIAKSVDGYFDGTEGEEVFVVRGEKIRWVAHNLPPGVRGDVTADGSFRVTASTAGLAVVAPFVVGLGEAAVCETAPLAAAVKELAEGALKAGRGKALNGRAVASIRRKG